MARTWAEDEALPLRFLLCALASVIVPWTIVLCWWMRNIGRSEIARAFPDVSAKGSRVRHCQTATMVSKRAAEMRILKSRRRACSGSLVFQVVLLVVLWAWLVYVAVQLNRALAQNALYQGFDPYRILGVDKSHGEVELKQAFRKVALKYHPDKNLENPKVAETKFLLARKALDALIEPESMENFKKYGNPDGPQFVMLFAVSSFIKDKEASIDNGKLTYRKHWFRAADLQIQLAVAIFCLMVGPFLLWKIFSLFEGDAAGCKTQLSSATVDALTEGLKSVESVTGARDLLLRNIEEGGWCRRRTDKDALAPPLFLAHVQRRQEYFDLALKGELEIFLTRAHIISRAMVELAIDLGSSKVVMATIRLQQCLLQALDPEVISSSSWPNHQLLQLPHIAEDNFGTLQGTKQIGGLRSFLELPVGERKARLSNFDLMIARDIEEFHLVGPAMDIASATVSSCSSKDIVEGDMARLRVSLRRKHLNKGDAAGPAHTPLFPSAAVVETWWAVLELPDGSLVCKRTTDGEREVTVDIEFEVPMAGKCKCKLSLMSEVCGRGY